MQRNQYRHIQRVYDMWLDADQMGLSMAEYLRSKKESKIAIYGMDNIGVRVYGRLKDEGMDVAFGIKNSAEGNPFGLIMKNSIEDCDFSNTSVIVTDFFDYYNIEEKIKKNGAKNVYSVDSILTDMMIQARDNTGETGYGRE